MNGYVLHDFAKADREWVEPLLAAIAENAPLLVAGNDATFMNRVHLATADEPERAGAEAVRRAHPARRERKPSRSRSGASAAHSPGLKKLFGREH